MHEDIQDRKSLVMISAEPSGYTGEQINIDDVSECTWLNQANIIFDEYHFIDYRMQKEDAQRLIHNASVIFYVVEILFCKTIFWRIMNYQMLLRTAMPL